MIYESAKIVNILLYSHDGTKWAIVTRDETSGNPSIQIVESSTKQKQQVFETEDSNSYIYGLSWSSDNKLLAVSYGHPRSDTPELRPKIYIIELVTNKISKVTNERFEEYYYPQFSPTDNLIAFQRYQPAFFRYTIIIKDMSADCQIELPFELRGSVIWSPDGQNLLFSGSRDYYLIDLAEYVGIEFRETGSICS